MKISLATLAVLLSAAAVHALPDDPLTTPPAVSDDPLTPPPATTGSPFVSGSSLVHPPDINDEMKEKIENKSKAGVFIVEGLAHVITDTLRQLKETEAKWFWVWPNQQERKATEAKEEELRKALKEHRKIAVERLKDTEGLQTAWAHIIEEARHKQASAFDNVRRLSTELAKLNQRVKSATAELQGANEVNTQVRKDYDKAQSNLEAVKEQADVLREVVAQIDQHSPDFDPSKNLKMPEVTGVPQVDRKKYGHGRKGIDQRHQ